jgi:hypothetical protein
MVVILVSIFVKVTNYSRIPPPFVIIPAIRIGKLLLRMLDFQSLLWWTIADPANEWGAKFENGQLIIQNVDLEEKRFYYTVA